MNLKAQSTSAAELMYEIDSLYVSTEMILGLRFREFPLDGLLLEACLLHFRVVWDFFYRPKKQQTDIVVRSFIPNWKAPNQPPRLKAIRRWLNAMLAHLTTYRTLPLYKIGEVTMTDVELIRDHTKVLFEVFVKSLTDGQRKALVNPLAHKFAKYETLKP